MALEDILKHDWPRLNRVNIAVQIGHVAMLSGTGEFYLNVSANQLDYRSVDNTLENANTTLNHNVCEFKNFFQ